MLKVGLTGGYASGKSLVAAHLELLGCHLIYADLLGHRVLAVGGEAYQPTLSLFGTVDRKALAAIVFGSPDRLAELNALVHPAVFKLEAQLLGEFEASDPQGIAIIEAAILIETGRYKSFDRLIVTSCAPETQIARAMERDQISREQAMVRIARQLPDADRLRHASYIINTDGSPAETIAQTESIYAELRQLAEAHAR